jgi:protein N-terminal methyltransferase
VGAGIGRVSKNVLLHVFQKASLLECTPAFVEKARALIPAERLETVFPVTMQDFRASERDIGRYDLVWIQWVIIYASDEGLVSFLCECMRLLRPGGKICIKDNVILPEPSKDDGDAEDVLLDKEDCSITRSERYLVSLAQSAGLQLVARELQSKFPKELFPVVMYAFTPAQ